MDDPKLSAELFVITVLLITGHGERPFPFTIEVFGIDSTKINSHLPHSNGACAHYVMVSKFQWNPFWLATQRDPQNDWTAAQNRVNNDVFAQAPLTSHDSANYKRVTNTMNNLWINTPNG